MPERKSLDERMTEIKVGFPEPTPEQGKGRYPFGGSRNGGNCKRSATGSSQKGSWKTRNHCYARRFKREGGKDKTGDFITYDEGKLIALEKREGLRNASFIKLRGKGRSM